MKYLTKMLLSVALASPAAATFASVITLDFEGINTTYTNSSTSYASILEFYDGGSSSVGTSGTNYGISFGSNALAICLNSLTVVCSNTSRGGLAPTSSRGGLFFLNGSQTFMNDAAGFDTGFSFNYSSLTYSGAVSVYSGLNGTGTLLGTLLLTPNAGSCVGYNAGFCPFSASGVTFNGIAHSISFAGVANQIVFDDVTFGSATPGVPVVTSVPEPGTYALMLAGLGIAIGAGRRKGKRSEQI